MEAASHRELSLWLVQIERFVAHGYYLDAIGRAKDLVREATRLREADPSDLQAAQLAALGEARLAAATAAFRERNRAVADRRLGALRSSMEE